MVGLIVEQLQGWLVLHVGPRDSPPLEPFAQWLDRAKKLTLLHGERAHAELDGGAFLQKQQCIEERDRILAAGHTDSDTIAVLNHVETADRLPNFSQEC